MRTMSLLTGTPSGAYSIVVMATSGNTTKSTALTRTFSELSGRGSRGRISVTKIGSRTQVLGSQDPLAKEETMEVNLDVTAKERVHIGSEPSAHGRHPNG